MFVCLYEQQQYLLLYFKLRLVRNFAIPFLSTLAFNKCLLRQIYYEHLFVPGLAAVTQW